MAGECIRRVTTINPDGEVREHYEFGDWQVNEAHGGLVWVRAWSASTEDWDAVARERLSVEG